MEEIKQFIICELEKKQAIPTEIEIDEYRFLDTGHIDSMGAMKFVIAIEDQFDIELSPEDIGSESFRSIGGLTRLIASKLS